MIDPSPIPSVSRSERREKEKDSSVARVPRDPEDPQKFQAIIDQGRQKKEQELKKKEEPVPSLSIFDISGQKARAREPLRAKSGQQAETARSLLGASEGKQRLSGEEGSTPKRVKGEKAETSKSDDADVETIAYQPVEGREGSSSEDHSSSQDDSFDNKPHSTQSGATDVIPTKEPPLPAPSNITPQITPVEKSAVQGVSAKAAAAPQHDLQQIIDHVVKTIALLQSQNQTDVVVTLRNPPIMEGAQLVLSSFSGASKEFNIAFYNLTQAAQQFLTQIHAEASIKRTLLERNEFLVHMFITSPKEYQPIVATDTGNRSDERRFRDEEKKEGKKQRDRET